MWITSQGKCCSIYDVEQLWCLTHCLLSENLPMSGCQFGSCSVHPAWVDPCPWIHCCWNSFRYGLVSGRLHRCFQRGSFHSRSLSWSARECSPGTPGVYRRTAVRKREPDSLRIRRLVSGWRTRWRAWGACIHGRWGGPPHCTWSHLWTLSRCLCFFLVCGGRFTRLAAQLRSILRIETAGGRDLSQDKKNCHISSNNNFAQF